MCFVAHLLSLPHTAPFSLETWVDPCSTASLPVASAGLMWVCLSLLRKCVKTVLLKAVPLSLHLVPGLSQMGGSPPFALHGQETWVPKSAPTASAGVFLS